MLLQPEKTALEPVKNANISQSKLSDKLTLRQSEWAAIIAEWEQSGLTQKAFCQQRGISKDLMTYYRCQIKKRLQLSKKIMPITVIPEKMENRVSHYMLTLQSGAVLSIPSDCNADTLQPLLKILGVF